MKGTSRHLWWVCTSNFAEGLPYTVITILSVAMFADMGVSNTEAAAWSSLLALPWAMKALWSPIVTTLGGERRWMWMMQFVMMLCFAQVVAMTASGRTDYGLAIAVMLGIAAVASATYDMACDGFYMKAMSDSDQSFYVGIRTTAYRLAMIFATGALTYIVGVYNNDWSVCFALLAGLMFVLSLVHMRLLPKVTVAQKTTGFRKHLEHYSEAFVSLFRTPDVWFALSFLLLYRLGEALLSKVAILFLKAPIAEGGLALSNEQFGVIYGTIGVASLIVGGILGGMVISRWGLAKTIVPLALLLNVPDLLYVWMSATQPAGQLWLIGSLVGLEQFGYGIGFTAYTVFLLQAARRNAGFSTEHYAMLTALMAVAMNVPAMLSGWMQENLGYHEFFWVATVCTIPGILIAIYYSKKLQP